MPEFHQSKRRILIPMPVYERLNGLAGLTQESNGVLLYTPEKKPNGSYDCHVHGLFMTAVGNAGHVQAAPDKVTVVNKFLENNPKYKFVKWHTHSAGTGRELGEQWWSQFSAQDIAGYEDQMREEPGFIGMVVSPTHILIHGQGTATRHEPVLTTVHIIAASPDHNQNDAFIAREIERAHRETKIPMIRLKASRKSTQ